MDIRLRALRRVGGYCAILFAGITGLNWLVPEYANLILGVGLMGYMLYIIYAITLSQMKHEENDL
jgi:hypothetical protein